MLEFITITGAILGWLSSAFIVYDRVLRSRPVLSLTARNEPNRGAPYLRITNPGDGEIVIREIIFQPEVYAVSKGTSPEEIAAARSKTSGYLIAPRDTVDLHLFVRDAKMEAEIKSPVRIIARWRKTMSMSLPQVPAGIWITTTAVRELASSVRS